MEIKIRKKDETIILDLSGAIDVNSANFIETIGKCIHEGFNDILCNFDEVEFIDYMGISVVAIGFKEVVNNKGRMKFINLPPHIKQLFSVTGMDRVVEVYPTEDSALSSFKESKAIENVQKMQLRRRFKRVPIGIKIELLHSNAKIPACLNVDLLNLSAVGGYIYGCNEFKLGDKLTIKIKLQPKLEEIEIQARVVWLCDKQVQPHLYPGVGVEFYNIKNVVQVKLIEFIERNLSLISTEE